MADEIDRLLRDALQRAARDGDPAGVADAIRARVDAGDPGASVAGSVAPGWGGAWPGWVSGVATVLLVGATGLSFGASGVLGAERLEWPVAGHTAVLDGRAAVAECPGGPVVGWLPAGTRVLAVERSEEGHVGVRDPEDAATVLWLSAGDLVVDADEPGLGSLPLGAPCPEVVVTLPTPEPAAPQPPGPQVPAPQSPGPAKDATPPVVQTVAANPNPVYGDNACAPGVATITVGATDDVGVTQVRATWSALGGGSVVLSKSGGQWTFQYDPPTIAFAESPAQVPITVRAYDAAGNSSAPKTVTVTVQYCLI